LRKNRKDDPPLSRPEAPLRHAHKAAGGQQTARPPYGPRPEISEAVDAGLVK